MEATAASADGRSIVFEAPPGVAVDPGGFAVVATEPPLLVQVTRTGLAVREIDGRRSVVLEDEANALGEAAGGFGEVPIAPATPDAIAAWADDRLDPEGLDIGALVRGMNSLRDVAELEASFSHVPEGLLRLAPGFVRGEALVAGALVPAPLHLRIGGRITPEGGGDVPTSWAHPRER